MSPTSWSPPRVLSGSLASLVFAERSSRLVAAEGDVRALRARIVRARRSVLCQSALLREARPRLGYAAACEPIRSYVRDWLACTLSVPICGFGPRMRSAVLRRDTWPSAVDGDKPHISRVMNRIYVARP